MDVVLCAIAAFVIIVTLTLYYVSTYKFNYWNNKKVPHLKPVPLVGNYAEFILLKKYSGQIAQQLCQQFPNEPYFGTFYGTEPALVVQDPDIIKLVLTKDFYFFNSREIAKHTHKEVVTQNMFFTYGDRWKIFRQNLTPLFSSVKMKNMFYLVEKCAHTFEDMLDYETSMSQVLEGRALMTRFTMDCIGSCVFGVDTNTMGKDTQNNPFKLMGELIFASSIYSGLKKIGRSVWPAIFYGLGFQYFPKDVAKFFTHLLVGVFESRQFTPSQRNDFVDFILSFYNQKYITGDSLTNSKTDEVKKVHIEVNNELLVAQCVLFFGAGFETSATTLSLCLFELSKNQNAQKRLQKEVDEFLLRHDNKLTYDCVTELPYLEACFNETMRLYPVLGILTRECVEDYTFPSGLQVEKGVRVHVPVYHLHHHPDYFPEPEQYRPERFLPGATHEIRQYTYFPFGEGPRLCIGMRFAKMQVFSAVITLFKKYNVELAEDMPHTLDFEPTTFLLQPACGIHLRMSPRSGWEQRTLTR